MINMAAIKSGGAKSVARKAMNGLRDESDRVRQVMSRIESERPGVDVTAIKKLADNLLYSEPAQAPKAVERALSMTIDDMEARLEIFLSAPDSQQSRKELADAAAAVDRALKARNEAILRSK
jgi:hypothetical protein